MRVALLTHQWPGSRMGGIGAYVRQCAAALADAGHEPHIFTIGLDGGGELVASGVKLHETPGIAQRVQSGALPAALAAAINAGGEGIYRLAIGGLLAAEFRAVHRTLRFDIVEAPDVEALGLPLLLDPARDVPVVTHLHCCTAIAHATNNATVEHPQRLIQALEFAAIHLADALCAPTQAVIEATKGFIPIDREPAIIAHPFKYGDDDFQPPPADGPLVFVGRIEWLKGCGVIAEALNVFLPRNPTARFRFIGPDTSTAPGARSMRRHILDTLRPDIAGRVEFSGELPRHQVDAELAACAFCVQPSLRENFSLACCEAMALGRTVIVGEGTGSVELVGNGGIVVERGSVKQLAVEMERLYRDRRRRLDLSRRAFDQMRTLCRPATVSARRFEFYRQVSGAFQPQAAQQRMETLPPSTAAALLPALSRMTGALTGALRSDEIGSPGARLKEVLRRISDGCPARVLLYGGGKHTARLLAERHVWECDGHRVVSVIDDHPRFAAHPTCLDLPVRSLAATEAAARAGETIPPIVLSTDTYEDQFWEQTAALRSLGVPVFRLYSPIPKGDLHV